MSHEVRVPNLGVAILSATIRKWLKKEGEPVRKGEPVVVVETEKVTFEVEAPADGVLLRRLYPEGKEVPVDTPLALVGDGVELARELLPAPGEGMPAAGTPGAAPGEGATAGGAPRLPAQDAPVSPVRPEEAAMEVRASPAARALARQRGVDLREVAAAYPGKRITSEMVERFVEERAAAARAAEPAAPEAQDDDTGEQIVPLEGVRKRIAENMVRSLAEGAQVTTVAEVDMTEVAALRERLRPVARERRGVDLTYLPFILRAALMALQEFPVLNATLDGDRIVIHRYVHLGVAVAAEQGLVVPVVRDAHRKSLWELAEEVEQLAGLARQGALGPSQVAGSTFTVSNAGAYGAILATPILYPGQSGLLWIGRVTPRPVVVDGQVAVRKMAYLCLTYDHRVTDGAVAAQYLQKVRYYLENPLVLLT